MTLTNNILVRYIKEVKSEMNKVVWPTKKETTRLTIIVLIISASVALFFGLLDILFAKAIQYLITL